MLNYIADTLGLSAAGFTAGEARRTLEAKNVDSTIVTRLGNLLETCEGVRYGESAGDPQDLHREAASLLPELAIALKRASKNGGKKPSAAVAGLALLALLLVGGCAQAADSEWREKFDAAQQAFDHAKQPEDFAKAAALDQEMIDRWGPSGAVYYNQGNSWMQAGQPGRAVAAYRQAERYRPRIAFLDANLATALNDSPALKRPVLETILFWQNWLSYAEKFYLATAMAILVFAIGVAMLFYSSRWMRLAGWIGLTLLALSVFSAGYDWYRFDVVKHGVVIESQTVARKGNADNYEAAFNKPLRESTEFRMLERRGDWLLVRLPDGHEGWIPERAAIVY
jgi:tetratricopeptide (TPR) repeat protein